jgi:integrase
MTLAEGTGRAALRRHHFLESAVQRAVTHAVRHSGISKRASCHTLRQRFAIQLLEVWYYDIRTVMELLGHRDVSISMLCTHVPGRGGLEVRSPMEQMPTSVQGCRFRLRRVPCSGIIKTGTEVQH